MFSFRSNVNKTNLVSFTTRVRHKRHERHDLDTSDTSTTRATQKIRVRHKGYTSDTSATRVKNFDFDNDTSETIFSHPYISKMSNERLKGEEQFHSKNYLLEMLRSHARMRLIRAP